MNKLLLFISLSIFSVAISSSDAMDHSMHDMDHGMHHDSMHSAKMHGPIGLMGDHFHKKGESMVSIRYNYQIPKECQKT